MSGQPDQTPAAPAAAPAGPGELRLRVISALVMAVAILVITVLGGWTFRIAWAAIGGLVLFEWLAMMGRPRAEAGLFGLGLLSVVLLGAVLPWPVWSGLPALIAAAGFAAAPGARRFALLGVPYAAVIAIVPPLLRDMPNMGLGLIIWTFAVVWFTDIAAYFTGRALGGPKLAPRFSPKKTWSGAIGGALAGTIGGVLVWWFAGRWGGGLPLPVIQVVLVSFVASALGQAGDIVESAFKRHCAVKDSSHLIPGHGGFMDRLDAYWAVLALCGLLVLVSRLGF